MNARFDVALRIRRCEKKEYESNYTKTKKKIKKNYKKINY